MSKLNSLVTKLRAFKRSGGTKEAAKATMEKSTIETARKEGWRRSELAMTLADQQEALDKVFK